MEEGEIAVSPMAKMRPPKVPDEPPHVLSDDELHRLLATCDGTTFEDRRDAAILRVFIGTGARLAEVTGLRWTPGDPETQDVDLDAQTIHVLGKGRRPRVVHMGAKAAKAIDRYLRLRARHAHADAPALWLGERGPMTVSRHRSDGAPTGRPGRAARTPPAPVPPRLRERRPHGWHERGRPHAARRMAIAGDAGAVRPRRRLGSRHRREPATQPGRPTVTDDIPDLPDLPERPSDYIQTLKVLRCHSCRTPLGRIWEMRRADGTRHADIAELETEREADWIEGMWVLGGPLEHRTRFQLPARVRCRYRHTTAIRWDSKARRWKTYLDHA